MYTKVAKYNEDPPGYKCLEFGKLVYDIRMFVILSGTLSSSSGCQSNRGGNGFPVRGICSALVKVISGSTELALQP